MTEKFDPWHIVEVQFNARPEHKQTRYEVINFIVSQYAEKVHRPRVREVVEYMDGMWNWKYTVAVIPLPEWQSEDGLHYADDVARALVEEGVINSESSVTVDGKRV